MATDVPAMTDCCDMSWAGGLPPPSPPPLYYYFFCGPLGTWRSILSVVMKNRDRVFRDYFLFLIYPEIMGKERWIWKQVAIWHLTLQMKGRWESNINVWFRFMYSQKWNCARPCCFQKKVYNVLSPNFHIHVSVSTTVSSYSTKLSSPIQNDKIVLFVHGTVLHCLLCTAMHYNIGNSWRGKQKK